MTDVKHFLTHELSQVKNNIARLNQSLERYPNGNRHGDGQRMMLAIQYEHYEFVSEMMSHADDPCCVEVLCLARLEAAREQHHHIAQHDTNHGGIHCDEWWQTLNRVEYLTYLLEKVNHLVLTKNCKDKR